MIYSISIIFVVGLPVCRRKSQTGQIAFDIVSEALQFRKFQFVAKKAQVLALSIGVFLENTTNMYQFLASNTQNL